MKRFLALTLCAFVVGLSVASCGGSSDVATADKLTIVGSGS